MSLIVKIVPETLYTSEWNKYATQAYIRNFQPDHSVGGGITEVNPEDIQDHDVQSSSL